MNIRQFWAGIATVLVAFFVQAGTAVYWAGTISARMSAAERGIERVEMRLEARAPSRPLGD